MPFRLNGSLSGSRPGESTRLWIYKDCHPTYKQLVLGVVARTEGNTYGVDVSDGNMDDPRWSRPAVLQTGSTLGKAARARTLFVADAKFVSQNPVADWCQWGVRLVARLAHTCGREQTTPHPPSMGSGRDARRPKRPLTYTMCELPGMIRGQSVRLIACGATQIPHII